MARRRDYPGYIRERGAGWQVILRLDGERHQYTVQGARKDAEQFARSKMRDLESRSVRVTAGLAVDVTFSRLMAEFENSYIPDLAPRTRETYLDSMKPLRVYFVHKMGDPTLDKIRAGHVRKFLTWRRWHGPDGSKLGKPMHGRTIGREYAVLRRLFTVATELEYREGNPTTPVKPPKYDDRQPVILDDDQFAKLLAECRDPMLHLWALLLAETGVRSQSEALWLRWDDIDGNYLHVVSGRDGHRTKGGRSRWVPLTPRLRAALSEHAAQFQMQMYGGKRSPWVFHQPFSQRGVAGGTRIKSLRRGLDGARDRAELPSDFRPHDLRHRRCTDWLSAGQPAHIVQKAMGHASIKTTLEYYKFTRQDLDQLVPQDERAELAALV